RARRPRPPDRQHAPARTDREDPRAPTHPHDAEEQDPPRHRHRRGPELPRQHHPRRRPPGGGRHPAVRGRAQPTHRGARRRPSSRRVAGVAVLSAAEVRARKGGERLAVLTAYDYPTALALDGAGLDLVLVGDSLGEVELGHGSTRAVTVEMMVHHVRAVRRGLTRTHLVADLPARSYDTP